MMRKILPIILILLTYKSLGQLPDEIEVNTTTTVYIIFDSEITLVDLSGEDYIHNRLENSPDMILLKAAYDEVYKSSILIRTQNDIYQTYLKWVDGEPSQIVYDLRGGKPATEQSEAPIQKSRKETESVEIPEMVQARINGENRDYYLDNPAVRNSTWKILNEKQYLFGYGQSINDVRFELTNIFVDESYMYFRLDLDNKTSLPFDLDFVSFELNESGKGKKNAAIQKKILDVEYYETIKSVSPAGLESVVYAVKIYAFEHKDQMLIRVNERKGERTLEFKVPGKELSKAQRVSN